MLLEAPSHLSPSSVNLFRDCPQKFKLSYIDKIKVPSTWHTVLGSFVHKVLECLYQASPNDRTQETLKKIASDLWSNHGWSAQVEGLIEKHGTDLDFKQSAFEALTNLWSLEDPVVTNIEGQEIEIIASVDGVVMKGYIDRISLDTDGSIVISDYKTGKVPNPKFKSEDDKWFQLLAYALMLRESQQKLASTLELFYLSKKIKHSISVTDKNLEIAQRTIVSTRASIDESCKSGEFLCKVTKLCDWCHFKKVNVCPAHNGSFIEALRTRNE